MAMTSENKHRGWLSGALIFLLVVYQRLLSPLFVFLGAQCRFHPSCSAYAVASVEKYGPWIGSYRAMRRLLKCHPLHPGGFDPA